ncbi:hypothetical protein BT246_72740 (plasmid) [Bacillus thuringiensis]|uniref:Uncharacterized protein n=1 Tax=Bacillus thuringiensis TaxID=1428 RepID=A0A9W3X4Y4_BACTU|nr:hypothetical protein [Bacillus thuringiensis]ANS52563.1 hypothetical protein BT246_72740 [Bacillus thuringiensis]
MEMEKIQPKFLMMENQENSKKVVAYMHGTVGAGWWGDINAKKTREMFDNMDADEIELHIHSVGVMLLKGLRFATICEATRPKLLQLLMELQRQQLL